MPKQTGRKIDTDSPGFICIAYPLAAFTAILVFRLFFPNAFLYGGGVSATGADSQILGVFRIGNSLTRGILDFISFFPAILISAQFIPFRHIPREKSVRYQRFSPEFFKLLLPQLVAALTAAIVYSLLFLIVRPICADYQVDIRTKSALFRDAKERALFFATREDWTEASRFLSVCERIWPLSGELAGLRETAEAGLMRIRYNRRDVIPETLAANIPGQTEPVTAPAAITLAESAIAEERYYDAHRLAAVAERLAAPGSVEVTQAVRLSSAAWNAIESLEPTIAEQERYAIYRRKREGYEAMNSGDWVRAYYIFRALTVEAGNDPDVQNFFPMCVEGVGQTAFFVDEMSVRLG
ncbi:MAG: hypothetical protein LBJ86_05000, partial [Spirochaetaceae bacterium]|nr:hypothetical protein [Spirochaetaceae bacterium]